MANVPQGERLKNSSIGFFIFTCIIIIFISNSVFTFPQVLAYGNADLVIVYFLDVGQGDSIFIDTSGLDVLIDGGPRKAGSFVVDYLNDLGVFHVDLVVATHPDADHIGGLITVLNSSSVVVDTVLFNGEEKDTKTYRDFMAVVDSEELVVAERGQVYVLAENVSLIVLNPVQPLEFSDSNDNSVVVKLEVGKVSFLFTGDITFEAEEGMLSAGVNLESDVLKVAHHGSKYSTSMEFLDAVNPTYAVISAGRDNPYGHPHEETIQRLLSKGVIVYGTFVSGTIKMGTDGEEVKVYGNPEPIPENFNFTLILLLILVFVLLVRKVKL